MPGAGRRRARFRTNPMVFAVPALEPPVVIDPSSTASAPVAITQAADRGETGMPCALDADPIPARAGGDRAEPPPRTGVSAKAREPIARGDRRPREDARGGRGVVAAHGRGR